MRRGEPRCGVNNKEMEGRISKVNDEGHNAKQRLIEFIILSKEHQDLLAIHKPGICQCL